MHLIHVHKINQLRHCGITITQPTPPLSHIDRTFWTSAKKKRAAATPYTSQQPMPTTRGTVIFPLLIVALMTPSNTYELPTYRVIGALMTHPIILYSTCASQQPMTTT